MRLTSQKRTFFAGVVWTLLGVAPAFAGGAVTGKVVFEGTPPAPKPINFGAEKQCALMHGDKVPQNEEIVVRSDGALKWTLVHLKDAPKQAGAAAEPALMDQKNCVFSPHVAAVQTGQKITFRNSDTVLHNVRSAAKTNKSFNIAQPIQGMETSKAYDQPELGIPLRCDVHFWMVSYLHVLDHPYFAVTGDDGTFTLKDVPPGTYTLEAWHEKLGTQTAQVTVVEGETRSQDLTFKSA